MSLCYPPILSYSAKPEYPVLRGPPMDLQEQDGAQAIGGGAPAAKE
jgi:hypothetical protein